MKSAGRRRRLGEILVCDGALTAARLALLERSRLIGDLPIGRVLVRLGWVTFTDVARAVAEQTTRTYSPPAELDPLRPEEHGLDVAHLRRLRALPIAPEGERPRFAVANPGDPIVRDELARMAGALPVLVVSDEDAIDAVLSGDVPPERDELAKWCTSNKRAQSRTRCLQPLDCYYVFCGKDGNDLFGEVYRGEVQDVAPGGARIEGTLPPASDRIALVSDQITIKCNLFHPEVTPSAPIRTLGQVRWLEKGGQVFAQFGVAWRAATDEDNHTLDQLLAVVLQRTIRSQQRGTAPHEPPEPPPSIDVWGIPRR